MLPPRPPSPPEGPPRGTYFSRRNATQPFPPSPAFTEIFASSTNILHSSLDSSSVLSVSSVVKAFSSCVSSPIKTKRPRLAPGPLRMPSDLVRGLRFCRRRCHADEASPVALVLKLHVAPHQRKQRVVLALGYVHARLMPRAALPDQDRSPVHQLPAEPLYAQPLPV